MFLGPVETCGASFQLFGGGPKRKYILKAGPTLFLAFDGNIIPHVKIFLVLTCDRKFFCQKWKNFPPQCNDAGRNDSESILDKIRYNQMYSSSVLATHPKRLMCVTTYQKGTNTQNSGLSVFFIIRRLNSWEAICTSYGFKSVCLSIFCYNFKELQGYQNGRSRCCKAWPA